MINILVAGNYKMIDGMIISALSITKHTSQPIHLYILTMDLRNESSEYMPITKKDCDFIQKIYKEKNTNSIVTLVDVTDLYKENLSDSVNKENQYTPYATLRLLADKIPCIPNKILYLDTDIVANDDITQLYNYDITAYEFAGVLDYYGHIFIKHDYINSGVMLLNMEKIRQTKLLSRALSMCTTKKMGFPDQSALNDLVVDKLLLPRKFNEQKRYSDDIVIQHFAKTIIWLPIFHTRNIKPWNVDAVRNKLKNRHYDDILDKYLNLIKIYKSTIEVNKNEQ